MTLESYFAIAATNSNAKANETLLQLAAYDSTNDVDTLKAIFDEPQMRCHSKYLERIARPARVELARGREFGRLEERAPDSRLPRVLKELSSCVNDESFRKKVVQCIREAEELDDQLRFALPRGPLPIKHVGRISEETAKFLAISKFEGCDIGERKEPLDLRLSQKPGTIAQMIVRVTHDKPCILHVAHWALGQKEPTLMGRFNVAILRPD